MKCNILQLLITFLAAVNVTLCQNVISYLLLSLSMFYNSCFILLNVFNVEKHIPKIESCSLPGKGDLYLYNPTKITDPSNDIWSTIHKVDTA